jgi:hypothetical protein
MPITVKHSKVSTIPDDADTSLVRPSDWNADHTLVGLGTMAEQNANSVTITGGTGTFTSVTTPIVQAASSAGLALKNSAGTTQMSMGAGGGDNITVSVPIAITPANALVNISPTGTGTVTINPAASGTINNVTIGATTAAAGSFTNLSVTGTTSFDGSQGIAGQVLTSAGTGNTPVWGAAPAAGAGGANTQIQFNNAGVLAGNSTYTMVSGVMKENGFNFVSQADVGSAPNQLPLNQYLGNMAYQDKAGVNITGGTATLATLNTTGNVGVGTNSPAASLHVAGVIGSSPAGTGFMAGMQSNYAVAHLNGSDGGLIDFSISGTDTRGRIIYTNSTNAMGFGTFDGVVKMTLDATGNLGIGVTSPTAKLDVSGTIKTLGYTVATLPTGVVGMRAYVTNALTPVYGATVVGGGAVTIPVFYNGTNWIVA